MQLEGRGRRREGLIDELGLEPHRHRLLVDPCARLAEQRPGLGQQHADAVLAQDRQSRGVEMLDLIGAEDLDRRKRVLQRAVAERPPRSHRGWRGRASAPPASPLSRALLHADPFADDGAILCLALSGYAEMSRTGSPSASMSTSIPSPAPRGSG